MHVGEAVRTSLEEVKGHPGRSIFTLVGVILGTAALVIVLSVLDGVTRGVWQGFDDLGLDGVLSISQRTPSDKIERAKSYMSRGLRVEDVKKFADSDLITSMSPVGETRGVITAGTVTRRVPIYGIGGGFKNIKGRKAGEGRFVDYADDERVAPVCVLGFKLKQQLFGGENAIGQQVNISGRRLTVIGVGTKFNMEFVNDDDMRRETEGIYIPFSIYETMYGRNSMSYILAKAVEPEKSIDAEDEATVVMQKAHNGIRDVHINNIGKEILKERGKVVVILQNWRIVFFSIAGISLIIGGVGIFSVLKISISERLFEIGLRKSMGASDAEIFMQFLIESITLSVVGAFIGVMIGVVLVKLISNAFPAGLPVSMTGLSVASGFAVSIGLVAGLYPSLSASRLQPVEALRA